jgi:hypothetical protein
VTGVLDALRGYVQLATGLTEVTVSKAREAAAALLAQGLDLTSVPDVPGKDSAVSAATVAASQVQGLADDLLETSKQNRELLTGLVRTEVDRAAGRLPRRGPSRASPGQARQPPSSSPAPSS